jgi:alpha-glucosidase
VHRATTRYGQDQRLDAPEPTDKIAAARHTGEVDVALGVRRARAAAFLLLALPGTAFLYQGEELGLPEVLDLPADARQDPIWHRSGGAELGRDGCRVPLPWHADAPHFGFTPPGAEGRPWLPQPHWFRDFAADRQRADPESTLSLTEALVRRRRSLFDATSPLEWLEHPPPEVLAFRRGRGVCVVNFGSTDAAIPASWGVDPVTQPLFSTPPPTDSAGDHLVVPADGATWFALAPARADAAAPDGIDRAGTGSLTTPLHTAVS